MNIQDRRIINQFKKERNDYIELYEVVYSMIEDAVKQDNIFCMSIGGRVKEVSSLQGKVSRKSGKYARLTDITDLCGIRVICYFSDDVDRIGMIMSQLFDVDYTNSIDKREIISATQFGYLSLHYVCSLRPEGNYPSNILGKKFEIQIRTVLQHTWAEIEHDLGYKSDFGVPRKFRREFSRIAGLLEIADEKFAELRENLNKYSLDIKNKIAEDSAEDILIDRVSLNEYMLGNKRMAEFTARISDATGAEVEYINPENYLEQLDFLGKKTIGDLSLMLTDNSELAFSMAVKMIKESELDIISSNVPLRYLCRAEIVGKKYSREQIKRFVGLAIHDVERIEEQTDRLQQYIDISD